MSKHLFGAIVTASGIAANNRGESEGTMSTLQKVLWQGDVHTTVSAEAIRWAIRMDWQNRQLPVNRQWDELGRRHTWQDAEFAQNGHPYIDDDLLGYMSARAAREEVDPDGAETPQRGRRRRGTTDVRRSRLEATRALSVSPWTGDVVFNFASVGATPTASRTGTDPVPYSGEVHATRYQYAFALTPESLILPQRALNAVDAIVDLSDVAGNHARYLYDFSPDAIIFRWTDDAAPRILYPFVIDAAGSLGVPEVLRRVRSGDITAGELIVGGALADTPDGRALETAGAELHAGVKAAANSLRQRLAESLKLA